MAQPVYATQTQLLTEVSPVPANAEQLLREASRRVDELLVGATYDVDSDDLPTDPVVAEVLADATCAMAAWLADTGDLTGAQDGLSSLSVGGVSWSRGTAKGGGTLTGSRYAPTAVAILRTSGALPVRPVRW